MKKTQALALAAIFFAFLAVLWAKGPLPQDTAYHAFADQRNILGIDNFWNVASNLPMFFLGLYGFSQVFENFRQRPGFAAQWIPVVLVFGIFITSFGSAYYHYAPDNQSLVWDRLPMTLMFMPVFSLLIYDFIGPSWGKWAFYFSVPLGVLSIFHWQYTESIGLGDLRLYAFVQFFPMLAGPALILLSDKKNTYTKYFWMVLGWYVVAKVFEYLDTETFELLGFWSGHTLKHLIGAISLFYLLKLVQAWEAALAQPK